MDERAFSRLVRLADGPCKGECYWADVRRQRLEVAVRPSLQLPIASLPLEAVRHVYVLSAPDGCWIGHWQGWALKRGDWYLQDFQAGAPSTASWVPEVAQAKRMTRPELDHAYAGLRPYFVLEAVEAV